jgi:ketosteroid isomerase-like protein
MGEARQVFDRFTATMTRGDIDEVASLYAEDATALSPEGELGGRKDIVEFLRPFTEAFSDFRWEPLHYHEDGNTGSTKAGSVAFTRARSRAPTVNLSRQPASRSGSASATR